MHSASSVGARPAREAKAPAVRGFDVEFWLIFLMLLLTAVFPAIAKYRSYGTDDTPNTPAQLTWSIMYLVAGFRLYAMRARTMPIVRRSAWLAALIGYLCLTVLWSVAPTTTLYNGIELLGTTMISLYMVVRFTLRESLIILALNFAVTGVASLLMIFGAPGHGRMDYGSGAWTGIFQEKNNLAAAMALGILTSVALIFDGSRRSRLFSTALLVLCVVLLVGSRSATATVATFAGVAIMLVGLLFRSSKIGTGGRIAVILSIVVAGGSVWAFGLSPDAFLGVVGRDSNLTGRTDFWPYLLQAIGDRPLLGYGYDAFFRSSVGADYLSYYVVEAGGWSPYHSHNSFLQVLLDGGGIAFSLLCITLLVGIVRCSRYIVTAAEASAVWPLAIVAYLIGGSFTETYIDQFNTFEMIVLVVALLYPLRAYALAQEVRPDVPRR